MKTQKWLLIASVVILLGAAALVAFTVVTPYVLAQGPMGWYGRGDGSGPMFGRGTGQDFGMGGGRGMMNDGAFGPGFGMGPGGGPGRMGPGGRWDGPENSLVAVAAEKLGLTNAELIAELQAGKSIADVAQEKNVDVDTIVEAVITPRSDRLKELVTNGQLTQEEVNNRLANLRVDVIDWLNQSWGSQNSAPGAAPDSSGSY